MRQCTNSTLHALGKPIKIIHKGRYYGQGCMRCVHKYCCCYIYNNKHAPTLTGRAPPMPALVIFDGFWGVEMFGRVWEEVQDTQLSSKTWSFV